MANGGDIIIKGGSVDIDFDNNVYPTEPGRRGHKSQNQTIDRVTVADSGGTTKYDSDGENASTWTITVYCK